MKNKLQLLLIVTLCTILFGCGDADSNSSNAEPGTSNKVSISLDWTPNTNHTGIYVARENGYYEDAGIDVEILLPGEVSAEQLTAAGKSDFGISFQPEVTSARAEELPIVSVAAIIQEHTGGYASPVEKGIKTPADFSNKVYGAYGSQLEESMIDLVMKRDNANADDVNIVQLGRSDFFQATKKDIDFVSIFYAWTGIEAEIRGIDLNFIETKDYAEELNTYSPVIITNEKMIKEHSETVQTFMEATVKGYNFAIDNPEEAADILINAEPDLDPELVKRSQEWLSPRYQGDADIWGIQETDRWTNFADFMYDNEIITEPIDAENAFTNEYIKNGN